MVEVGISENSTREHIRSSRRARCMIPTIASMAVFCAVLVLPSASQTAVPARSRSARAAHLWSHARARWRLASGRATSSGLGDIATWRACFRIGRLSTLGRSPSLATCWSPRDGLGSAAAERLRARSHAASARVRSRTRERKAGVANDSGQSTPVTANRPRLGPAPSRRGLW
jgi:hypothetical protein